MAWISSAVARGDSRRAPEVQAILLVSEPFSHPGTWNFSTPFLITKH